MSSGTKTLERFSALSDGIFAVIITVMVLDLRPPTQYDLHALINLWPAIASYMLSYAFIAVVWLNHHHVFNHAKRLTLPLAWSNFGNLFAISLIPFTTSWLASSSVSSVPMSVYASVFLLVELTYMLLMRESFKQDEIKSLLLRRHRTAQWIRAWVMVIVFLALAGAAVVPAGVRMAFMAVFLIAHGRPDLQRQRTNQ